MTNELSLKLFSLLMAIVLFFFVNLESTTPVDVEFAVDYRTDEDQMVTNSAPNRITTTLKGPWAALRSLATSDLEPVVVDLSGRGPGLLRHRIETSDIHPPTGMVVISISPSELEIDLDRRIEKEVPVEVVTLGRPAFGFKIAQMQANPARVRVAGPLTEMQTLDFVYTRPVDLQDREEELQLDVELRLPLPPIRLLERKSVKVFVDISEESSRRNIEIPVLLKGAPEGSLAIPSAVSLTIQGPQRLVDVLDTSVLVASVDVTAELGRGLTEFDKMVEVTELPERTQVVGSAPKVAIKLPNPKSRGNP
ncbi:MAG: CdaR family protein [Myxococcota bacterium]